MNLWDSIPDSKAAPGRPQRGSCAPASKSPHKLRGCSAMAHGRRSCTAFFTTGWSSNAREAISKDPQAFPGFDEPRVADLRTSLMLFLDQVVWSERSDYRELLQANTFLLNERLGKLYGKSVNATASSVWNYDPKSAREWSRIRILARRVRLQQLTRRFMRCFPHAHHSWAERSSRRPMPSRLEDAKFDAHLTMREKSRR